MKHKDYLIVFPTLLVGFGAPTIALVTTEGVQERMYNDTVEKITENVKHNNPFLNQYELLTYKGFTKGFRDSKNNLQLIYEVKKQDNKYWDSSLVGLEYKVPDEIMDVYNTYYNNSILITPNEKINYSFKYNKIKPEFGKASKIKIANAMLDATSVIAENVNNLGLTIDLQNESSKMCSPKLMNAWYTGEIKNFSNKDFADNINLKNVIKVCRQNQSKFADSERTK